MKSPLVRHWRVTDLYKIDQECSYAEACERGKFMTAASKILIAADSEVLEVTGLVGLGRNVADADRNDMSKHLEGLVFGWNLV